MGRRANQKHNTRRSGSDAAHRMSNAQNIDTSMAPKKSPRLLKQLEMNLCMQHVLPRAQIESPNANQIDDNQYNLRRRLSSGPVVNATTSHVNKRKSKGKVRLFGQCDNNPNLWLKSTRTFFLEERFESPIYKLIEYNKKAMLAFQEPTSEPSTPTTTKRSGPKRNAKSFGNNNIEIVRTEKSQNDTRTNNGVLVHTVTASNSIDPLNDDCIDFEDQIVSYKLRQDVNMNEESISVTKPTLPVEVQSPIIEIPDDSEAAMSEQTNWEDSSEGQNDDVQFVGELQPLAEAIEKENLTDAVQVVNVETPHDRIDRDALEAVDRNQSFESAQTNRVESVECELPSDAAVEPTKAITVETDLEIRTMETTVEVYENLENPRVGQLVWAQLGKYPFWPAIVTNPAADDTQSNGVHVMFLADNMRTAFIKQRRSLLPFRGLQQYLEYRTELLSKEKRKTGLKFARIALKMTSNAAWKVGVHEGDVLTFIEREHRLHFYREILTDNSIHLKRNHETISISSASSMGDLDKSSSPCTFDTAYSSMKPSSVSSSASVISNLSSSSSIHMYVDGDEQPMDQTSIQQYSTATHIEYYLRHSTFETSENAISATSTIENIDDTETQQEKPVETIPKLEAVEFGDIISTSSMRSKTIHDSILHHFKKDIIVEGKRAEFNETHAKLELVKETWRNGPIDKGTSKRKRSDDFAVPAAKVPKIAHQTARLKARHAAQSVVSPQPPQPPQLPQPTETDSAATEKRKMDKQIQRLNLLKQRQQLFYDYAMLKKPTNYLFRKVSKDLMCQVCLKPGSVLMCKCGGCYHRECSMKARNGVTNDWYKSHMVRTQKNALIVDLVTGDDVTEPTTSSSDSPAFECGICLHERPPQCIVCSATTGKLIQCLKKSCDCYYHIECLKYWPQHKVIHEGDIVKRLMCPRHVCQICIADNPHRNYASNIEGDKALIKCLLCPATYHRKTQCIPAGSEMLSQSQMVCPRHRQTTKKPINTNWCFLCTNGGKLICCETCPTTFHIDCLKIPVADDKYICEDCESGRLPLYGETVWAKYGTHKWWPAMLVDPLNIPERVAASKPGANYMCIYFFGTYNYGWVCQGYMYLHQTEDSNFGSGEAIDKGYHEAVMEASRITNEIKKEQGEREITRNLPPYTRIKVNQPMGSVRLRIDEDEEENECMCSSTDENPCGPENKCINYALSIECNPTCPAKERCQNQRFAKRIYPKVELKYFDSKGWGLIARENIACNTFIIEYVGDLIDSDEFTRRFNRSLKDKADNFYFLTLGNGLYIDAAIRGNEARFINHSCEPNCSPQKWTVGGQTRIGLFAITDIPIDTELSFDYNWSMLNMAKCVCHCGTPSCSGFIGFKQKTAKKP